MGLAEVRELVEWAGAGSCIDFQERFHEVIRQKVAEVDSRITDLEGLKQDLQRLEVHLAVPPEEVDCHSALECDPEACSCLG